MSQKGTWESMMQELLIGDWQLVRVGRPRANVTKKDDVLLRNKYFLTV